MEGHVQKLLPNMESQFTPLQFTPLSSHLYEILRDPLGDILPQETHYQECFDRFEYLFALVHADMFNEKYNNLWAPIGCFGWRNRTIPDKRIMKKIQLEFEKSTQTTTVISGGTPITQEDSVWPPLKAGLFGGDIQRFRNVKQEFDSSIKWPPQRWI